MIEKSTIGCVKMANCPNCNRELVISRDIFKHITNWRCNWCGFFGTYDPRLEAELAMHRERIKGEEQ